MLGILYIVSFNTPNQVPQNWRGPSLPRKLSAWALPPSSSFLISPSTHFEKNKKRKSACWVHQAALSDSFYFSIEGTYDNKTVFQEAPRVSAVTPMERASSSLLVS